MTPIRIHSFQFLRGAAAIMIFFHHFLPDSGVNYNVNLGEVCVLFFFVLSGFLMAMTYEYKVKEAHFSYKSYIVKRFSKLLPLLWIMTIVYVVLGINVVSYWAIPFHLTLTQSFIPLWQIDFTINTVSWFLSTIAFCYLLCPFLLKMYNEHRKAFSYLYAVYLSIFVLSVLFLPDSIGRRWLAYINPFARIIDFVFGFFLYSLSSSVFFIKERKSKYLWTLAEILAILIVVICICNRPKVAHLPIVWLYIPISFLILTYSYEKGYISSLMNKCIPIQFVGSVSLSFYMAHGLIYSMFLKHWTISLMPSACICIALTLIISWLFEQYILSKASLAFVKLFSSKQSTL